jgi:DNA-binding NarL/FixJ family response regulator
MEAITVLVVDRERAVAQAIAHRLDAEAEIAVVGRSHSASSATEEAERSRPDVVILDEGVANGRLAEITARLIDADPTAPVRRTRVVVTSDHDDVHRAYESVRAGASGVVTKASGVEEMVQAIHCVASGESWIPRRLLTGVLDQFRFHSADPADDARMRSLTVREREVLQYMLAGFDRARIAERLMLSVNTVRTHTQNILSKLGVHSSVEAVSIALQSGLSRPLDGVR